MSILQSRSLIALAVIVRLAGTSEPGNTGSSLPNFGAALTELPSFGALQTHQSQRAFEGRRSDCN